LAGPQMQDPRLLGRPALRGGGATRLRFR
jgi:hypothetical protein